MSDGAQKGALIIVVCANQVTLIILSLQVALTSSSNIVADCVYILQHYSVCTTGKIFLGTFLAFQYYISEKY